VQPMMALSTVSGPREKVKHRFLRQISRKHTPYEICPMLQSNEACGQLATAYHWRENNLAAIINPSAWDRHPFEFGCHNVSEEAKDHGLAGGILTFRILAW
jgi:hypothetical protein